MHDSEEVLNHFLFRAKTRFQVPGLRFQVERIRTLCMG